MCAFGPLGRRRRISTSLIICYATVHAPSALAVLVLVSKRARITDIIWHFGPAAVTKLVHENLDTVLLFKFFYMVSFVASFVKCGDILGRCCSEVILTDNQAYC